MLEFLGTPLFFIYISFTKYWVKELLYFVKIYFANFDRRLNGNKTLIKCHDKVQ